MAHRFPMLPALLAGLALAGPLAAQTTPTPATAQTPAAKPAVPDRRTVAVERRIADLHARLKIMPGQQKPFDDFAQVMRDNASRMGGLVQSHQGAAATGTAVDQMRGYSEMAQAHAEDVQHLTTAFSTLYDALSADQKKLADQSFRQFASQRRSGEG